MDAPAISSGQRVACGDTHGDAVLETLSLQLVLIVGIVMLLTNMIYNKYNAA